LKFPTCPEGSKVELTAATHSSARVSLSVSSSNFLLSPLPEITIQLGFFGKLFFKILLLDSFQILRFSN
jgi:hypothetical protein